MKFKISIILKNNVKNKNNYYPNKWEQISVKKRNWKN